MTIAFKDLSKEDALVELNSYLQSRSYICGWTPSQADVIVFKAVEKVNEGIFPHISRWWLHIKSFSDEIRASWRKADEEVTIEKAEEEDFDLFGDDDDEEDEEAEAAKEKERQALYAEALAKKKKKGEIAKSNIVIDIKPLDDETDMADLEKLVRTIEHDGLLWGGSQLKDVAFGIKKLVISAVVEDEKCGVDDIEEKVDEIECVQSMDVVSFSKI